MCNYMIYIIFQWNRCRIAGITTSVMCNIAGVTLALTKDLESPLRRRERYVTSVGTKVLHPNTRAQRAVK